MKTGDRLKKATILLFIFTMFIFMSGCEKQKSYEDLLEEFQNHLDDRQELYQEQFDFFNTASTQTVKTLVMVNVSITPTNQSKRGSGVIFQESATHYFVLTNHHVVHTEPYESATLRVQDYQGNLYNASLIISDPAYDLAIISFPKSFIPLDMIPLSVLDPEKDESMIIMGYPNMRMVSITMGNLVNYSLVNVPNVNETVINIQFEVIMTFAPVYFGSSGSLVINQNFELIGIVFSAFIPSHSNVSEVTLIIPVSKVTEFINLYQGGITT